MKNRSITLLLVAACSLSISVMSAASKFKAMKVAEYDHSFDVSKIVPMEPANVLAFHSYDMEGATACGISFERNYTTVEFVIGEVNNKALPLSRKLWLMNCQIALK